MSNLKEPDWILAEFLRAEVPEPDRVNYTDRHSNQVDSQDGTGAKTTFTVSSTKLLCINNVTADGTVQRKYVDYDVDLRNNQITFATAPTNDTSNVLIDYDFNTAGTSWIYTDKPRTDLGKNSYPRVSVMLISEEGVPEGLYDDDYWNTLRFQIDVYSKKDLAVSRSNDTNYGQFVVDTLARDVISQMKNQWRTKLVNTLYYPNFINNSPMPYDKTHGIFRRTIEVQMNGEDVGE
jgi:hypothetical protein